MGAHLSIPSYLYKPKKRRAPTKMRAQVEEVEGNTGGTRIELPVTPSLEGLEKMLGYKFKDKKLLQEAYIHASFNYPDNKDGPSYERLEFIGDSVLNVLVATKIFVSYPQLLPGPLTKLRSANVDNEKLARVAMKHGFHRFLWHKNHHLVEQIQDFSKAIMKYPIHSNGLINPPKFLADIVESTIGAIYVDSNFSLPTVWKVFKELLEPVITPAMMGKHPYTELKELCQKEGLQSRIGTESNKLENSTTIEVLVDDVVLGSTTFANGSMKKEIAQNRAAKEALDKLKKRSHPINSKKIAQNRAAKEGLDEHELKQTLLLATDDDHTVKDSTLMVITPHR